MSDAATVTDPAVADPAASTAAPAAAAAPAAPATAAPAAADPNASLLQPPDPYSWLPEKYRVTGADGKVDVDASGRKMSEGLSAAVKRIGTGDVPPASPTDYAFQPPEQFKDAKFDDEMSQSFREQAHKLGLTNAQYQGVMESYLELVPGVLDSVAKLTTEQARAELQKVWQSPAEFEAGLENAQRMVNSLPQQLGQEVWARFGRDPLFFQVAAIFGKEMVEDKSPGAQTGGGSNLNAEQLMASEAFRNPKHPEHAETSAKVRALFERQHGTSSPFQ